MRLAVQVLAGELGRGAAGEGRRAGEHFLVDDCQAILVAGKARAAVEQFRWGILRGQAAEQRDVFVADAFDQAEIGDLDAAAGDQQILRLDVEVLQSVAFPHVV